jgi:membrane-bound inhibitor of C-type lysozyme
MKRNYTGIIVLAVIVVLALAYGIVKVWEAHHAPAAGPITKTTYQCENSKSFVVSFSGSTANVTLSDGRMLALQQQRSGSGIRYAAGDVVFISEGSNGSIQENDTTTYANCAVNDVNTSSTTPALSSGMKSFTDAGKTFTFMYPQQFSVHGNTDGYTQSWMNNANTSGLILAQIDVPKSTEPGTNFSDAKFTVGTSADTNAVKNCLTYNPTGGASSTPTMVALNGTTYTVFHSSDAGAGNLYDTTSYRAVKNSQCYAIEYTVHSTQIGNYPAGTVSAFNANDVQSIFGTIMMNFRFL